MPATLAPAPSDAPVGQQKKGTQQAAVAPVPFARASKWHIEQSNTQAGIVLNSAAQQTFNYPIASYGFLSAILITVVASGGAGTAATPTEDSPWNALANVVFQDVNGVPIYQLPGFSAYLAAKWGGYRLFPPDGYGSPLNASGLLVNELASYVYSPIASGGTGNFKFLLPIYFEFGVGGNGCLPNMDASARYNLQLTFAAAGTAGVVYAVVPTTFPTASVTVEILARSQPPAQDMYGNQNAIAPPAVGTVQYWTSQSATGLGLGANTIQLSRVGNIIRHHILVWRHSDGTRLNAESTGPGVADVPAVFEFDWDVGQRYVANTNTLRYIMAYAVFGFDVPNGMLILPNTTDPDKIAISEYGDEWIATVGASKLVLRFSAAVAGGSLTILTNDIVPASAQVYQAPSLLLM